MQERLYSFLYFIAMLIVQVPVLATDPGFVFSQISIKQGLSESSVVDMIEDSEGYMWICTEDGLNRYNGYEFQIFRNDINDPFSVSSNDPRALCIDSKRNLWIGTFQGVNIYNTHTNKFDNFKGGRYPALNSIKSNIEVISEDSKGTIWLGGEEGLFEIKDLNKPAVHWEIPWKNGTNLIKCITPDSEGDLWIGTVDGLLKFSAKTKQFTDLRVQFGAGYIVNSLFIDCRKNVWIGTTKGLKKIEKSTHKLREFFHDKNKPMSESIGGENISDLISFDEHSLLLSIDGDGIDYFNLETEKFIHYTHENDSQLSCNNIIDIFMDSKRDLWVGTFLHGINYSNSSSNLFHFRSNNINSNTDITKGIVTSFLRDQDQNLWVTTDGGGLYCKKKNQEKVLNYNAESGRSNLSSDIALYTALDNDFLYIATYDGGLNVFNKRTGKVQKYLHQLQDTNTIASDQLGPLIKYEDKIWIAVAGKGIDIFDPVTKKFKHCHAGKNSGQGLPSQWINCFFKDSQGALWIGTTNGLCKFNARQSTFKNYSFSKVEGDKNKNAISDIAEDRYGNLWLATRGAGIIKFCEEKHLVDFFTIHDGIPGNNVKTLTTDQSGNLWVGTNNGVASINIRSFEIKNYTYRDGVSSNSFYHRSKFLEEDGKIYFGCSGGYLVINPALATINTNIPPVVISDFKINNQTFSKNQADSLEFFINHKRELSLNYNQNAFTFEFAALNFNSPEENLYSFYLEGFDNGWSVPSTKRFASYTNLNPGNYIFKVKASNNDGIWNEEGTQILINIEAPFYKKWWFMVLEGLALIILLYGLYKWRLRSIKTKTVVLENTVNERTKALKDSNDQLEAFVYKASHDIKGPLKSIIGLTTIGRKDVEGHEVAVNYFNHILKSTQKLDKLLAELLEVTNIKQAELNIRKIYPQELIREVTDKLRNLENFEKVTIQVDAYPGQTCMSDKVILSSILKNLVENSIKYYDSGKETSFLKIHVGINDTQIKLQFSDNGIGFPQELYDKVFEMFYKRNSASEGTGLGLYIVKTSVEKLKGRIEVKSVEGLGTTFTIFLPNESPSKYKRKVALLEMK